MMEQEAVVVKTAKTNCENALSRWETIWCEWKLGIKGANTLKNKKKKTTLNNWSQLNSTWCDCALCMLHVCSLPCTHTQAHQIAFSYKTESFCVLISFSIFPIFFLLCFWLIGSTTVFSNRIKNTYITLITFSTFCRSPNQ